jgi:hypothetical protein
VNYPIWLLTAALAAGPADGQPCSTCQPQQVIYSDQQVVDQPQQRTGLFPALRARLENMRHREPAMTSSDSMPTQQVIYAQPTGQPMAAQQMVFQPVAVQPATQVMYARPMPLGPQVVQTNAVQAQSAAAASSDNLAVPEVKKAFQGKIGAADDYSWVTGQLFYVHADGGVWVLRYGAVDTEDKFGGSVVLAPAVEMRNYREGDLVSVTGEILSDARASRHLGGPLYRADTISMMERADH